MKHLFILCVLCLPAFGTTYYISQSAGDDTRSSATAQNKATPWKHFRGMAGATSTAASYTPVAGDSFILKGCDVWVNSDLPVLWDWSGTPGNVITIGVDKTWFNATNCPSTWNRPVWDGGKTGTSSTPFIRAATNGNTHDVTLDNIEMKGISCTGACGGLQEYIQCFNSCTNWTFSNSYFHGWNIPFDGNAHIFHGSATMTGTTFTQNVIDGSDQTVNCSGSRCGSMAWMYPSWPPTVSNNIAHDISQGLVGGGTADGSVVSGNQIYNVQLPNDPSAHSNILEPENGSTMYIYNNVMHDAASGAEDMFFGAANQTLYAWNNIWYNTSGNPPEGDGGGGGAKFFGWNNTVVKLTGSSCFIWSSGKGGSFAVVTIENTHCVTSNGSAVDANWGGGAVVTRNNNILQTPTVANGQGYTSAETFAFSPINTCTGGTCSTLGAGKQICGVEQTCTGNFSAMANDTPYACSLQTITGVVQVVCPARTTNARKTTPDSGAYEFTAASGPVLSASPNPVAFGNVNVGSSGGPTTVSITNIGTGTLAITSVFSNNARFTISSDTCSGHNAPCSYAVTFSPLAAGALNATITITDNAGNPDTTSATGTGVAVGPTVSLSTTALSYGNQRVNSTSSGQTVTLTNSGNATLNITSIVSNDSHYTISGNTCGASLTSGNNCIVTVSFTPTALGLVSSSLVFTTNASSSPDSVALTGTGVFITHVSGCSQGAEVTEGTGNSYTFQCTPSATGDAVVIFAHCHPSSGGAISAIGVTASGWTINQIVAPLSTGSNSWGALFGAIAPNTSATTFTATFTGASNCGAFALETSDEFAGNNTSGGSATFGVTAGSSGASGTCSDAAAAITPNQSNGAIYYACLGNTSGVNSPFTAGAFFEFSTEYILNATNGSPQSPSYIWGGPNSAYVVEGTTINALGTTGTAFGANIGIGTNIGRH